MGFLGGAMVKNPTANAGDVGSIPESLEKEMTTHYSILAWESHGQKEPGSLQSMGSQKVGYDLVSATTISPLQQFWISGPLILPDPGTSSAFKLDHLTVDNLCSGFIAVALKFQLPNFENRWHSLSLLILQKDCSEYLLHLGGGHFLKPFTEMKLRNPSCGCILPSWATFVNDATNRKYVKCNKDCFYVKTYLRVGLLLEAFRNWIGKLIKYCLVFQRRAMSNVHVIWFPKKSSFSVNAFPQTHMSIT